MLKTKKGKTVAMGKKGRMAPFGAKPAAIAPIDSEDGEDDDEELPAETMMRGVKRE